MQARRSSERRLRRALVAVVLMAAGLTSMAAVPAAASTAPSISGITPPAPDAGEAVDVTLTKNIVTGEAAGVEWQTTSMPASKVLGARVSTNVVETWRATVPGQPDGTMVTIRPFTRDAAGNDHFGASTTFTAREKFVVGALDGPNTYDLWDGGDLGSLRTALANAANFGPVGIGGQRIELRRLAGLRAADLRGMELVVPGLGGAASPTDAASRDGLVAFVRAGGALLLTEDLPSMANLSGHFGVGTQTTYQSPRVATFPPGTAAGTPVAPGTHPIFDGPFGRVTTFNHFYNVNWYQSLGAHGVALATTSYEMADPAQPTGVQTTMAVVPPGALVAGSGPVVIVGDVDILTEYPDRPSPRGGFETHPALAKNLFAWLLDPSGPLSVSASISGTVTEGTPASAAGTVSGGRGTPTTSWSAGSAPCTFASPASATSAFTCRDDGTFVFTFTAMDADGPSSTAVSVTVANAAPTAPGIPTLATGASPSQSGSLNVDWAGSTDPGDDVVRYALEAKDTDDTDWTEVTSGISGTSVTVDPPLAEGTWTLRVVAADDASALTVGAELAGVVVDSTAPAAPVLAASPAPAYDPSSAAGDEWWVDDVTVEATGGSDPSLPDSSPGSGDVTVGPATQLLTTSGLAVASAVDAAGNVATSMLRVQIDREAPSVGFTCPTSVPLGSTATGSWSATDGAGSGLVGPASGLVVLDTSSYGLQVASTPPALDNVGNRATGTCTYSVAWPFDGFRSPVGPEVNRASAGSAVPLKFSLGGARGLGIFAAGSPSSRTTTCDTSAPVDDVEETVTAGSSSLQYDAATDTYTYVWKTNKAWAGSCRTLSLALVDGSVHQARFVFKR